MVSLCGIACSLAEHLRRRRLVKARPWASLSYAFEQAQHPERIDIAGVERLLERQPNETLGGEIVDLVGLKLLQHRADIALFEKLHVSKLDVGENAKLLEPARIDAGVPTLGPDHAIASFEKRLGEIRPVLT